MQVRRTGGSEVVLPKRETVDTMIKLSQNENPLGASPMALRAIADNYHSVYRYPDIVNVDLKERLARKFSVPADNIVVGPGAVGIVDQAIKTLVGFDENIVTAAQTFVAYKVLAAINGRACKLAPVVDHHISVENMLSACDAKTKLVLIANPNNPTGTMVSHSALGEFLEAVPRHIVVVIDEAYAEYVNDRSYPDSFGLFKEFENLIILRTFSKIYGLAGLRIGYGFAHREVMRSLAKGHVQFSINRLAAVAALAALEDTEFVKECAAINDKERSSLYEALKGMGFDVVPSQANFLLVEFSELGEKDRVFRILKEEGILVQELEAFGVENGLRITVGRPEENKQLIECLKAIEV
jgi:histidinol-phosphate aminotransferase